jgi:hypothetical protein
MMSTSTRQGTPKSMDPDFEAVFDVVLIVLSPMKKKVRARAIDDLLRSAMPAAGVDSTAPMVRAMACLREAIHRACAMRHWELPTIS